MLRRPYVNKHLKTYKKLEQQQQQLVIETSLQIFCRSIDVLFEQEVCQMKYPLDQFPSFTYSSTDIAEK